MAARLSSPYSTMTTYESVTTFYSSFLLVIKLFISLSLFANKSGSGMSMGYGGYSQPIDPPNNYGGGSYGSMGMMNPNNFSAGMTG